MFRFNYIECFGVFLDQGPLVSQPQGDTFVSCSLGLSVVNAAHKFPRYPLAYAVTVIPTTVTRWVQFNHNVSSAALFFGHFMFNLSGAFNVLLFLTVRSELLLFNDSDITSQPTDTGSVTSNNAAKYNHSTQPTGAHIVDDVPPLGDDDVVLSHIDSRPDV